MSDTTVPAGDRSQLPQDDGEGPFLPGTRVGGRYTIEERIGMGGMGVVYRARQDLTDKRVALKVIRSGRSGGVMLGRFLDEIRLLGRLEHHGLASIHDADLHPRAEGGDVLFFTMDLVEGVPITTWAQQRNPDRQARLSLVAKVCEAMQYAHDHGVIHCDLKPGNILVRRTGEPVVIDFGLAYFRDDTAGTGPDALVPGGTVGGLGRGFAGTPSYMSPEQFQGGVHELRAGQSVDVYALGVVAFELLAGRLPYDLPAEPDLSDLRRAVLFSSARHLVDFLPDIDPELDRVVAKALRKDPADRYFSVAQFLRALSRFLPSAAPAPDPVWRPAAGQTIPSTNWIIDEKLGEGGVGEVWTCHHRTLKNKRIVKFCTDEAKASFLRRELTLYKLLKEKVGQNPHFARLEEVALEEPPRYLMSEFIEASDFSKWCAAHRGETAIPEATLLEIVAQAADALQAAHDAGVIHRDVKPSNLLLRGDPADVASIHVWVGDFGIGQVVSDDIFGDGTRGGFTRTLVGKALSSYSGTHLYMAPELLSGGDASVRSDIYALGVVLYQALAGDFQRALTIDWAGDIPDPLLRADLAKCFARDPAARFPSAGQLADHLRRLPERRQKRERADRESARREKRAYRRGLARAGAIATAIIALVAGLGWYAYNLYLQARTAGSLLRINVSQVRINEMKALRLSSEPERRANILQRARDAKGDVPQDHLINLRNETAAALGLKELAVDRKRIEGGLTGERAAISERGEFLVALEDGSVRLRKRTGSAFETMPDLGTPPADVHQLVVADDGSIVVAVGESELVVWDRGDQTTIVRHPSSLKVSAVAVHHSGRIAVSRDDGRIELFERRHQWAARVVIDRPAPVLGSETEPEREPIESPPWTAPARQMAFDPTGERLAVVSPGSLWATVWAVDDGRLLATAAHEQAPLSVAWNAEGGILATATEGGEVKLWGFRPAPNAAAAHLQMVKQALTIHETGGVAVRSLQFSANGSELYAWLENRSLRVLEAPGWRQSENRDPEILAEIERLVLTREGGALGLTRSNQSILWPSDPRPVFAEAYLGGQSVDHLSVGFGDRLVAAANIGRVSFFGLPALDSLGHHDGPLVSEVALHPSKQRLFISAAKDLDVWEAPEEVARGGPTTLAFAGSFMPQADCHGIVADDVGADSFLAFANGAELKLTVNRVEIPSQAVPDPAPINSIAWCPWAKLIAVSRRGTGGIEFHSVPEHQVSHLGLPGADVRALASGVAGGWLAVRTVNDLRLVRVPSGVEVSRLELPAPSAPVCVAVSRDGSMLAVQDRKGTPVIIAVRPDGTLVAPPVLTLFSVNPRRASVLAFGGTNDSSLIVGTEQGFVQAWQLRQVREHLADVKLDWSPALEAPAMVAAGHPITAIRLEDPPEGKPRGPSPAPVTPEPDRPK